MTAKCMGKSLYLARPVGTAYALGIFLQFLNNNLIKNDVLEAVVLTVFLTAFVILLLRWKAQETLAIDGMGKDQIEDRYLVRNRGVAACMLILIVALMACIFASLDNAVTLVHAAGEVDVGQWPRLLLALSGLAAGCAFDWKQRKYMSLLMYCVTLLSTACVVIIEFGGEFLIGLAAFSEIPNFAEAFTTYYMKPAEPQKLPGTVGIHLHVGEEYAGHVAYLFTLDRTTGLYQLHSTVTVNAIGNVMLESQELTDVMILVGK